ncbi:MAG: flagellar motor switch protein FliG [Acidimicrobiales bacterium]|jgi:flagellar motor switch protein FliG
MTTAETTVVDVHEEQLVVQRGAASSRKVRYENLTGQQKVAIVLAQLRPETSSMLLKAVGDEEAIMLATEIANLPALDREVVGRVLEEFVGKVNTTRSISQGGLSLARRMLAAAIGEERATQVMPSLQGSIAAGPLTSLSQADPTHVVPLLVDEHPQTVAVILAHMPPNDGSRLLDAMPSDFRAEVAVRIATMGPVSPEAISIAAQQLANKLRGLGTAGPSVPGGVPALVELLNRSDGSTEKQVLASLEERNPELAEAVRAHMFTFEDVLAMEDRTLQLVLRGIKIPDLALAIKPSSDDPEVMDKIKRNLSDRAQAELTEEIEVLGAVRMSQVDNAQSNIVRAVRELEASGEIVIARQTDQML